MKALSLLKRKVNSKKNEGDWRKDKINVAFLGVACGLGFFVGEIQAVPQQGMRPILNTAAHKSSVKTTAKKTSERRQEARSKKKVQKKAVSTRSTPSPKPVLDLRPLRRLEAQILQVRMDRRRWEEHKKGLLAEFANHQSAFAATLPDPEQNQPSSSLLLALFSNSMDDFVHSRVMMNYLNAYRMQKNQAYVNLVNNIQQADYALQNYGKLEQQLLQQWQLEKTRIDALQTSAKPSRSNKS